MWPEKLRKLVKTLASEKAFTIQGALTFRGQLCSELKKKNKAFERVVMVFIEGFRLGKLHLFRPEWGKGRRPDLHLKATVPRLRRRCGTEGGLDGTSLLDFLAELVKTPPEVNSKPVSRGLCTDFWAGSPVTRPLLPRR